MMSAAGAMRRAVGQALAAHPALAGVSDGIGPRGAGGGGEAVGPVLALGPVEARAWGTLDRAGAEVLATLVLHERTARGADATGATLAAVEAAVAGLAGRAGDGWTIRSARIARTRIEAPGEGARGARTRATVAVRLRCLAGEDETERNG